MKEDHTPDIPSAISLSMTIPKIHQASFVAQDDQFLVLPFPKDDATEDAFAMNAGGNMMQAIMHHKITEAVIVPPSFAEKHMAAFITGLDLSAYRLINISLTQKKSPHKRLIYGIATENTKH